MEGKVVSFLFQLKIFFLNLETKKNLMNKQKWGRGIKQNNFLEQVRMN